MSGLYRVVLLMLFSSLFGCTTMWQNVYQSDTDHKVSSSLMDYLYPAAQTGSHTVNNPPKHSVLPRPKPLPQFWSGEEAHTKNQATFTASSSELRTTRHAMHGLKLPLRVGLAFIPSKGEIPGLSEARKVALMQEVKRKFEQYPYIQHVQVIPKIHFRSGNGFEHIERMGQIYQLDVMALVSYDQVIHTDDNHLSFLYLTVVGAFVIPGSDYDTQTFVDTAIFDVRSKKLLLRATGIDNSLTATTLIGSTQMKRSTRYKSFNSAFKQMVGNIDIEMSRLQQGIASNSPTINFDDDVRATGRGSMSGLLLLPTLTLFVYRRRYRSGFSTST